MTEATTGRGRALNEPLRESMESKLGHDFSAVRIHDDATANRSARSFGADAYTLGSHVLFARHFANSDAHDRELLMHELVHVVQSSPSSSVAARGIAPPAHRAEQEAAYLTEKLVHGALVSASPQERVSPGTVLPRLQTTRRDFHDPNFCYRPGMPRDSTHPDRSKVVAVMQAQIETPETCDGTVFIRTSVLQSGWGAHSAEFESYGGGQSQGIWESLHRDDDGERVDYEEAFSLDTCHAEFRRCHLITFYESGTKFTFAEAGYHPAIAATSAPHGTVMIDQTPQPDLVVEPCNHVAPTLCPG